MIDNSGSISERVLSAFFAEVGGVLADVRPRKVVLIWCDAEVRQVDEARSLDELADIRVKGSPGGGGTDFNPPFEYLATEDIVPDTLVYVTDLMGSFPEAPPGYSVVWCASTDLTPPFGDVVRIKVRWASNQWDTETCYRDCCRRHLCRKGPPRAPYTGPWFFDREGNVSTLEQAP